MKVLSFTGKTEEVLRIYKPISHIVVVKDDNFYEEKIEVNRVNGLTGSIEKCSPRMFMRNGFEIGAHGEGMFTDSELGSRGAFAVGMSGSVKLSDQRYLEVDLTGLNNTAQYTIYGLEQGDIVDDMLSYHPMVINSDETEKEYGTTDKELLALPIEGLTKVELVKDSGQAMTYTPDELMTLMEQENDLVCVKCQGGQETFHWGFMNYSLLDISDVKIVRITKEAGAYEAVFLNSKN